MSIHRRLRAHRLEAIAALVALATNAALLGAAAWNRAGAYPDALLELTERELRVLPQSPEATGLSLRLTVANINAPPMSARNSSLWRTRRAWLDREQLQGIGFEFTVQDSLLLGSALPRRAFVVLEMEGPAWNRWIEELETPAQQQAEGNRLRPPSAPGLEQELQLQRVMGSRLLAVDVGLDAEELHQRYDASRYAIVPGIVRAERIRNDSGDFEVRGSVERLLVSELNAPRGLRQPLEGIGPYLEGVNEFGRNPLVQPRPPRFRAVVAIGRRHQPWLVSVERDESAAAAGPPAPAAAIPVPAPSERADGASGGRDDPRVIARASVDLRIGGAARDPEYRIAGLADVAATTDGTIFVADRQLSEIRRYDSDGRYLGVVTAPGVVASGGAPTGGLSAVSEVEALSDDRISARARSRLLVFDSQGTYLADLPVQGSQPGLRAGADGTLLVPWFDRSLTEDLGGWRRTWQSHVVRMNQQGETLEIIALANPEQVHQGWVVPRAEGILEPFLEKTLFAWGPDGMLARGRNSTYSIRVERPGVPPIEIQRQTPRVPLRGEEREVWLGMLRQMQRAYDTEMPPAARLVNERAEEEHLPEFKPYFRSLYIDDDGRIWVHRYVEAESWDPPPVPPPPYETSVPWREPPTFDVFAHDGRFLGTVVLPRLTRFTQARADTLWGIQADASNVQYVVRMKLEPPLGG